MSIPGVHTALHTHEAPWAHFVRQMVRRAPCGCRFLRLSILRWIQQHLWFSPLIFLHPIGCPAASHFVLGAKTGVEVFNSPSLGLGPAGFKPFKTLQRLFWHPWPAGQRTKATSIAFYWRSSVPFARLQTLPNLPKPSKGFFGTPDPQAKAPRRHQ